MMTPQSRSYQFGDCALDLLNLRLTVGGEVRTLEPKSFRTLQFLIENRHRVVSKDEILAAVWEGAAVTDNSLTRVIAQIRRALDDDPRQPRYIETIQTVGYRFVASIVEQGPEAAAKPPIHEPEPRKRRLPLRTIGWSALGLVVLAAGLAYLKPGMPRRSASIAVLPFTDLSGSLDTRYLTDGITESVRDSLSELPNLTVMSRSAVARYQSGDVDARVAGLELGVRAVLSGRVTQRGDSLVVSAELTDIATNRQLWGAQYNRSMAEALAVQGEIADHVAEKLELRLSAAQRDRITLRQTGNPEAYQAYLKGRYFAAQFTQEGLAKGLAYLRQAIALDPAYALAYDGLAYYYAVSDDITAAPEASMPLAKEAARRALQLDDSLVEAHVEMGTVHFFYDFDWAAAERELERAIGLNPRYAPAHAYYGWYLTAMGHTDQGAQECRRAVELDPLSPEFHAILGWSLYFGREYDQAVTELRKGLDIDPDFPLGLYVLGQVYAQQKRFGEAILTQKKAAQVFGPGGDSWPQAEIARDYALDGKLPEARRALEELQSRSGTSHVIPFGVATVYAALGETDRAMDQLEQAYRQRSWFLDNLKVDPKLDSLRSDTRFRSLSARMKLP